MPAWAAGAWAPGAWAGTAWAETGVSVPDVVGDTQADGILALEGAGFVVAVEKAYSDTVPAGEIVSQSPAAGAEVPAGSTVTITVSLGPEPQQEGGGGPDRKKRDTEFWYWLEKAREQLRQREERRQQIAREVSQITEEPAREIAKLIKQQDEEETRRTELAELRTYAKSAPPVPGRMKELIRRAAESDRALIRLEREMVRAGEEEEEAIVMALLMLN